MPDRVNSDRIVGLIREAHAIVADSQPQLAGFTFEFLHVAFAAFSEAMDRGKDFERLGADLA